MTYVVTEGVESTWHYHLSEPRDGRETWALCGARVMNTTIPISAWGTVGHLRERWCSFCETEAGEARRMPSCTWTYDDSIDSWNTSCGQVWQFTTGGIAANKVRFCHWCGLRVDGIGGGMVESPTGPW